MMILQQTRGALSSGDQLALDLPFAETKSIAARVGPTPVLTRGSTATYFGPNIIDVEYTYGGDTYNVSLSQDQIVNGRWQWRGGQTEVYLGPSNWLLTHDSNLVATSAPTTSWRPDDADWSGTGATVTTGNTFGIVGAANNEPRFDHDPVTLESRGLLIEEGRTNICRRSDNFGTTWSAIQLNTTGTPPYLNVATAPDGATTADKLIASTTNSTHQFRQDVTLVSGTSYTISVYFKAAEVGFATIAVFGAANGNGDWVAYFNISASSPGTGVFNGFANTSLIDVGNGWRRCSVTFTATASGILNVRFGGASSSTAGSNFYSGNGVSGLLIWGAQLEAGSFPTSYIPTTTTALTRSADVCGITNTSSFWNSSEFTVFTNANFVTSGVDGYASNFNITGGFFGARRINTNTAVAIIRSSGVNADIGFGSFTTGSMRMAVAHMTGQQAGSLNGGSTIQRNSAFVASLNPIFNIGAQNTSASGAINGHIAAIRYYRKRLPNAKLEALTA